MATSSSEPADIASVVERALGRTGDSSSYSYEASLHPAALTRAPRTGLGFGLGGQADAMTRMFDTELGTRAANRIGNEGRTLSILGDLAAEAMLDTIAAGRGYTSHRRRLGANVRPLIVPNKRDAPDTGPATILLLDPDLPQTFTPTRYTDQLDGDYEKPTAAWQNLLRFDRPNTSDQHREVAGMLHQAGPNGVAELLWIAQPEVVLAPEPEMEFVGCPSPALEIGCAVPGKPAQTSSAGMFCRDADGHLGVTACHHGTGPVGTAVTIGGLPGVVGQANQIQDIVFIPLPEDYVIPNFARGLNGPRTQRTPGQGDPAQFEGRTSGLKNTVVSSYGPGLLDLDPLSQNRIQTPAAVNQGDSGSALIDEDDRVLGFAFRRTRYGAAIEFADWIWAANALAALGLQPV